MPEVILGSITRQMSCQNDGGAILQPARDFHAQRKEKGFAALLPSLKESIDMIIALTAAYLITTIVIDALDECDRATRKDLMNALEQIISSSTSLVKLFVSSRDDYDIVLHLEDCPNLRITPSENEADIETFIDTEVDRSITEKRLLSGKPSTELSNLVKQALRKGAGGMFRWVELQLQYMCSLKTKVAVQKRLGMLPAGLHEIYDYVYHQNIANQDDDDRAVAEPVFHWLLCAQETILLSAVSQFLKYDEDVEYDAVLHLTANLVVNDKELDVFRFAHLSVRDFLETKCLYNSALNHAVAAGTCLSRLTSSIIDFQDEFTKYAARYWTTHVKMAEDRRLVANLASLLADFLDRENNYNFVMWSRFVENSFRDLDTREWGDKRRSRIRSMMNSHHHSIFAICTRGNREHIDIAVRRDELVTDIKNIQGDSALHVASQYRYSGIVADLLERGANVNAVGGSYHSALGAASCLGHEELAKLLLLKGADVNAQGGWYDTALSLASFEGKGRIIHILLQNSADINAREETYGNALCAASVAGHCEAVEILLNNGADMYVHGHYYGSALCAASHAGKDRVDELLLTRGADINAQNLSIVLSDALTGAILWGNPSTIEILLDNGAETHEWN